MNALRAAVPSADRVVQVPRLPANTIQDGEGLEELIAHALINPALRRELVADPVRIAAAFGLHTKAREAFGRIDTVGLELASRSFARKRHFGLGY